MTTIFEEAEGLVAGPRQEDYGTPEQSFRNIAKMWTVILKTKVTPEQVALCMVVLKISRYTNKPGRDSLVDACGYLRLVEMLQPPDKRPQWLIDPGKLPEDISIDDVFPDEISGAPCYRTRLGLEILVEGAILYEGSSNSGGVIRLPKGVRPQDVRTGEGGIAYYVGKHGNAVALEELAGESPDSSSREG